MTRRDRIHLVGKRAALLQRREAASAWRYLAVELELLGEYEMPKWKHLVRAIRRATINARRIKGVVR